MRVDDLPAGWSIEPLTGTLGAVLHGVDLSHSLTEREAAAVRSALLSYRVVFFRDQQITPVQQVQFARTLGTLTPAHPLVGGLDDDHPEVLQLDSDDYPLGVGNRGKGTSYNNRWHTDVTFSATPPAFAVLAGRVIPRRGGDTLWADLVDAYETLSTPIQRLLDDLVAVHDASATFNRFRNEDPSGEQRAKLAQLQPVRHPVVRVHPETGERGLFVNDTFTAAIEGLSPAESDALLRLLYEHTIAPERVVRWHWREGDVAVWDNRSTAHYAAADYTERRVMHRITVAGDRPVGVHGSID
ncbi:MAG: TauD/TfdA family dioxygenase [Actinobacteria bacterium]|nr:TauD/TfdA family dioxygenase [Actinomycetota bacterium]